jgi:hypothetical protein
MGIVPKRRSAKGEPMRMDGETRATTSYLPEIAIGRRILKIVIEFCILEMKEKAQVLSHLDLVVSQIPM